MNRTVLVAVDLSENSLRAVDYVGEMMAAHASARITLLHVLKEPSPDVMPDAAARQQHVERARTRALTLLEEAAGRLRARSIAAEKIHLRVESCDHTASVAQLILGEQQNGGYATIAIGRRGVSKREEFLFGSVSSGVVREARRCTVWVVQ